MWLTERKNKRDLGVTKWSQGMSIEGEIMRKHGGIIRETNREDSENI